MTTAKEVITDALEDLTEQSAEEPIAGADGNAALRYLNDMMFMWDAKGVALGYTEITNLGENLTVARGAIAGIKAHLSIFLAAKFSAELHPGVIRRAREGWLAILNLAVSGSAMNYPSILPIGSGNSHPSVTSQRFYGDVEDAISTENGGLIALELGTTEE